MRFVFLWLTIIRYSGSACAPCLGLMQDGEICGQVADGRDAVEKCRLLKPDLLILDICMPKLNGVDAAGQILRKQPRPENIGPHRRSFRAGGSRLPGCRGSRVGFQN